MWVWTLKLVFSLSYFLRNEKWKGTLKGKGELFSHPKAGHSPLDVDLGAWEESVLSALSKVFLPPEWSWVLKTWLAAEMCPCLWLLPSLETAAIATGALCRRECLPVHHLDHHQLLH